MMHVRDTTHPFILQVVDHEAYMIRLIHWTTCMHLVGMVYYEHDNDTILDGGGYPPRVAIDEKSITNYRP